MISIESHSVLVITSLWEYFNLLEGVLLLKDQVIAIKFRDRNVTKWFNSTLFREHILYRTVNITSSSNTPDKFVRTPYQISNTKRKQRRQRAKEDRRLSKTRKYPFTTEIQRQDSQSSDVYPIEEHIETDQDSNMSGSGKIPQPIRQVILTVIITQEQLEQLFERAVANEAPQRTSSWSNNTSMENLTKTLSPNVNLSSTSSLIGKTTRRLYMCCNLWCRGFLLLGNAPTYVHPPRTCRKR